MATWQPDRYGEENPHTGDLAGGAYISTTRIILLSIISMGIYWFYWMYRTWKQYRDHTADLAAETGERHYPVWHTLTQLVLIYGFFRYHAHIRHYKALMQERGIADSLNLGMLTTIVVINTLVGLIGGGMRDPSSDSSGMVLAGVVINIISLIVTIGILCRMQSNLNRYWADVDSRLSQSARFGKGEIVLIVIGVLLWLGTIAGFIWPG